MHFNHEDVDESSKDGSDVRSDDRNPEVIRAIRESLCSEEDCFKESGSEISGRIYGETGVCSERKSDAKDDESDQNRHQTFVRSHVFGISQRHNTDHEKESTKDLISKSHFGCGKTERFGGPNTANLAVTVQTGHRESSIVNEVDENRSKECAEILANEVEWNQIPLQPANNRHGKSHCRIDMTTANATACINTERDSTEEAPIDGQVAVKRRFSSQTGSHSLGHRAISKRYQEKRPQHLCEHTSYTDVADALRGKSLWPRHCPLYCVERRTNEASCIAVRRTATAHACA